jgi:hypothetical protein
VLNSTSKKKITSISILILINIFILLGFEIFVALMDPEYVFSINNFPSGFFSFGIVNILLGLFLKFSSADEPVMSGASGSAGAVPSMAPLGLREEQIVKSEQESRIQNETISPLKIEIKSGINFVITGFLLIAIYIVYIQII